MKNLGQLQLLIAFTLSCFITQSFAWNETAGVVSGNPGIESINALAFGPDGILFIGDSKQATIFAIDTKDQRATEAPTSIELKNVDEKAAAMLGTTAEKISIQDMAVNPISKVVYLAVQLQDGTPVILTTKGEKFEHFDLADVSYSKMSLTNPVAHNAEDRRGRSLRTWAVSDLSYHDGKVLVSGLSNEEFSSTFRAIPYPFVQDQMHASLEIYHAAHGRYETYAPIKTFMAYPLNGKDHLIASYTCTPLVIFPMDELKAGQHTKGKTVAELGNRNTPLDIISYKKNGKPFILMANSSRAVMKIDPSDIEAFSDFLTTPVKESSATAGIDFLALPFVNVLQMDKLDDSKVVFLQRMANGELTLYTVDERRL